MLEAGMTQEAMIEAPSEADKAAGDGQEKRSNLDHIYDHNKKAINWARVKDIQMVEGVHYRSYRIEMAMMLVTSH